MPSQRTGFAGVCVTIATGAALLIAFYIVCFVILPRVVWMIEALRWPLRILHVVMCLSILVLFLFFWPAPKAAEY